MANAATAHLPDIEADEPILSTSDLSAARDRLLNKALHCNRTFGVLNPKIGLPDLTWSFCRPGDWTAGFWSGILWLGYQQTGDSRFRNAARARRRFFQAVLDDPRHQDHDLGFQFILTSAFEYDLTGDMLALQMGLRAAQALRNRYQPIGRYIKAWDPYPGCSHDWMETAARKAIIDSMQNISLLFWANRRTGVASFRDVALAHAETTANLLVRDDYSTFHTYDFDPVTQEPTGGSTHQGLADDSCWARGQAWAIHGFAQTALNSRQLEYAELAAKLADYVIERLPEDGVPEWDYSVTDDGVRHRDSSAGAITAAGLFIVAETMGEDRGAKYRRAGLHMLKGLMERCDVSALPRSQGFLDEGAYFVRQGHSRAMLPYGDYYYLEAILRALGHTEFPWGDPA
jgi:unsaturated chondroitin disaccharide hydrolase